MSGVGCGMQVYLEGVLVEVGLVVWVCEVRRPEMGFGVWGYFYAFQDPLLDPHRGTHTIQTNLD